MQSSCPIPYKDSKRQRQASKNTHLCLISCTMQFKVRVPSAPSRRSATAQIYLLILTFMVISVPGVFVPCPSNLTYIVILLVELHP